MADARTGLPAGPAPATSLRLLADDLTGALDTAAELVPLTGPIPTFWPEVIPASLPAVAAWDSGTRERTPDAAVAGLTSHLPALADATIAFKKIDSLLRGPTLAEIVACVRSEAWDTMILAPAFPFQGRITRAAVQHSRTPDGDWEPVGGPLLAQLRDLGVPATRGAPARTPTPGLHVFDAETEADLHAVVDAGQRAEGRVLWIGTGGLAQSLAVRWGTRAGTPGKPPATAPGPFALRLPILGLFGSDQSVTQAQLAACGSHWLRLAPGDEPRAARPSGRGAADRGAADRVAARLAAEGRAVVSLDLPPNLERAEAARRIATALGALVCALPPPGTLVVAGGETLRALCQSLGATSLSVQGRLVPGLPWSKLQGGPWNGVTVISKSGAFGPPSLLRDLLAAPHVPLERTG